MGDRYYFYRYRYCIVQSNRYRNSKKYRYLPIPIPILNKNTDVYRYCIFQSNRYRYSKKYRYRSPISRVEYFICNTFLIFPVLYFGCLCYNLKIFNVIFLNYVSVAIVFENVYILLFFSIFVIEDFEFNVHSYPFMAVFLHQGNINRSVCDVVERVKKFRGNKEMTEFRISRCEFS